MALLTLATVSLLNGGTRYNGGLPFKLFILALALPSLALARGGVPFGVLAELDCFSVYRLVKDNRPPPYEMFRALFSSAAPEPILKSPKADNERFVATMDSPRKEDLYFLHGMLKPLKWLNDKGFDDEYAGKEDVNAARNLFRILFFENLAAHPELTKAVVARFTDFKTLEVAFDPRRMSDPSTFEAELNHVIRVSQIHFDQLMILFTSQKTLASGERPGVLDNILKAQGLSGDFRAWHLFGLAKGNPDKAVAAARQQGRDFDREHGIPMKAKVFTDEMLTDPVKEIEQTIKPGLLQSLGSTRIFENYEGTQHKVLSMEAIDILRKVAAGNKEEYVAKVAKDFETRFNGIKLTEEQVLGLRDYFAKADDFQPTVRFTEPTRIDLSGATDGVLNVDFAGQNVVNMYHTMGALAISGQALKEGRPGIGSMAIEKAREGERKATARLMELKATFDAARKAAGVEGEYQSSGDDGSVILRGIPEGAARDRFYRELLKGKAPASDYRVVWVPPMKGASGVDTAGLSRESVKGENFEKALRGQLHGKVSAADLKSVGISVDLNVEAKTYKLVFFGPQAAVQAVQAKAQTLMATSGLAPEGYRLALSQAIW